MARYLCHLDQPKKHRYDPADVQAFGALDYQRLIMAGRDEDNLLDEMMEYIDENCITSFRQFCVYVEQKNRSGGCWSITSMRHSSAQYI